MEKFEFLEHPADLKIRSFGKDLPELFINAALGMMQFLYGQQQKNHLYKERIEVLSSNLESLLVDWLAEILYMSDTNKRAYISYKIIEFDQTKIIAEIGSKKAKALDDIKGVTYHELAIKKHNNLWQADVVYDI